MFFRSKPRDTIDLAHGTVCLRDFLIDAWVTDEVFLGVFGDEITTSKKQATYTLRDVDMRIGDISFVSMLIQFSPIGYHGQRVVDNILLYAQPCKYTDYINRIAAKLPDVDAEIHTPYDYRATNGNLRIIAQMEPGTMVASLRIEYGDTAMRVNNWVNSGSEHLVTPKSGALKLNHQICLANLKERSFQDEELAHLPTYDIAGDRDGTASYVLRNIMFYDLACNAKICFRDNKLVGAHFTAIRGEELKPWLYKHFGNPVKEADGIAEYRVYAAGPRYWTIRAVEDCTKMDWELYYSIN